MKKFLIKLWINIIKNIKKNLQGDILATYNDQQSGDFYFPAIDFRHLLIADDEAAFCKSIELLLRDRSHRKQLVDAAYLFVSKHYDWNVSNQQLNQILLREKSNH